MEYKYQHKSSPLLTANKENRKCIADERPEIRKQGELIQAIQLKSFKAICENKGEGKEKQIAGRAIFREDLPATFTGSTPDYTMAVAGSGTLVSGAEKIAEANAPIGNAVSQILSGVWHHRSFYYKEEGSNPSKKGVRVAWKGEAHDLEPFNVTYEDVASHYKMQVDYNKDHLGYGVKAVLPVGGSTKEYTLGESKTATTFDSTHSHADDKSFVKEISENPYDSKAGDFLTQITVEPSRFAALSPYISYLKSNTCIHLKHGETPLKITYSTLLSNFKNICLAVQGKTSTFPGWEKYNLTAEEIAQGVHTLVPAENYADTAIRPSTAEGLHNSNHIWLY